jgi:O-methyltransferase
MSIRKTSPLVALIRRMIQRTPIDFDRYRPRSLARGGLPRDFEESFSPIWRQVRPYTMTSPERGYALYNAIRHVVRYDIPGSIVECGVWRGGSMMLAALTLIEASDTTRDLYLFDTFAGMVNPSPVDRRGEDGAPAADLLDAAARSTQLWGIAPLEEVETALASTDYPSDRVHFVQGPVEETVPKNAPEQIALLRLDTDWYESTKHELFHLTPRVVADGILIVDDYGHWLGARQAVDEYLEEQERPILLNRIDNTGRIAVMPSVSRTSEAAKRP